MSPVHEVASTTISVVGGRGFLGRRVTSLLLDRGHRVHVFDRTTPPIGTDGVDARVLASDFVVWAASSINPMIAENDPDRVALDIDTFRSFVESTTGLTSGPRTILLSSGGTVYDERQPPPYSELSPVAPGHAYGRAKLELERTLLSLDDRGLVLRVSNAYGPGQPVAPGQGVVSHWIHAIAAGHDVHLFGDGSIARDYVFVDDIADAVRRAIELDYRGHAILNIGASEPTTLRELFATIAAASGDPHLVPHIHAARSFDARSTWLDCTRAMEGLDWSPRVSLLDGIRATLASVSTEARGGASLNVVP
jgi:UDP-glucose 4-epimerase